MIDLLDRHYDLVVVDTGTGILHGSIQGVLAEADQIVVVMPPALDGVRVAAATLDWLDEHGHADLVRRAVAVVNGVRGADALRLDRVEEHFARRCAATVRIPWDRALQTGAMTRLGELGAPTRQAFLDLAAAVADDFRADSPASDPTRTGDPGERSPRCPDGRHRCGCPARDAAAASPPPAPRAEIRAVDPVVTLAVLVLAPPRARLTW